MGHVRGKLKILLAKGAGYLKVSVT